MVLVKVFKFKNVINHVMSLVDLSNVPGVETFTGTVNWFTQSLLLSLPIILKAVVILILGWVLAKVIEKLVKKSLIELHLDKWEKENKIDKALYGIQLTKFIPSLIKWYIFLAIINDAANKLDLPFITQTISNILVLIPEWFVGSLFMGFALIIAHRVNDSFSQSNLMFGSVGAKIIYFLIVYFALVLSLPKFGFTNTAILVDAFRLIVAGFSLGLAIAIGVSFGAALKKPVKDWMDDLFK